AEGRYLEIPSSATPDRMFDRQWAQQIFAEAGSRLRAEYLRDGHGKWLEILDRMGSPGAASLADEASRCGIPLNTLKSHLRRARLRHAEIIRELVADTVSTPEETETELRHLL